MKELKLSDVHLSDILTTHLKAISAINDDEVVCKVYEGHESTGRYYYISVKKETE